MTKLYIIDDSGSSAYNGIGTYVRELICCLQGKYNVTKICFNADVSEFELATEDDYCEMRFPMFKNGCFMDNPQQSALFLGLHIDDNIDNIFFLNHSPCSQFLTELKSIFPLSKSVFVIHDLYWTAQLRGKAEMLLQELGKTENEMFITRFDEEKCIFETVDQVICLNDDSRNVLIDIYNIDRSKVVVIPNGLRPVTIEVEKNLIRQKLNLPSDDFVMLYVGRLSASKGVNELLSALHEVVRGTPKARLVVIGGNIGNSLNMISVDHRVASRIIYTGQLSRDELQEWYRVADIGIIPSYSEQCSYVAIEMMANELPIIASDGFGLKSMFTGGLSALVVRHGCNFSSELTKCVQQLATNSMLREELAANSTMLYRQQYSTECFFAKYQALIDSLTPAPL